MVYLSAVLSVYLPSIYHSVAPVCCPKGADEETRHTVIVLVVVIVLLFLLLLLLSPSSTKRNMEEEERKGGKSGSKVDTVEGRDRDTQRVMRRAGDR